MNYSDEINNIWLLAECSSLVGKMEKCLECSGFMVNRLQPEPGPIKGIVEKMEDMKPGVVVLQAGCPGFDSFELCHQLKTDPRLKPVPHIIFGCENHAQNSVKAFRAGAEYYVALAEDDCRGLVRLVEKLTGRRPGMA